MNFGPVILKDGWREDYAELFGVLDEALRPAGAKVSRASGDRVLRYRRDLKRPLVAGFKELLAERMPCCRVRYAF